MATDRPLSQQDLEQFHSKGYIKVRAFAAEVAAEMEETIWQRLEKEDVRRDDPTTWGKYPSGLSQAVRKSRSFREAMGAEFAATVDQLLGQGRWQRPKDCGTLLYTFPEARAKWDVTTGHWHWHGNPLRNLDRQRDIFIFCFLNRVEPEGGGTVVIEGSHHVVCKFFGELTPAQLEIKTKDLKQKFFASDPWLRELTNKKDSKNRRQKFMAKPTNVHDHPLRVVELTGEPGEAYITNMSTMHSRSYNVLSQPRFMTAVGITQDDPA